MHYRWGENFSTVVAGRHIAMRYREIIKRFGETSAGYYTERRLKSLAERGENLIEILAFTRFPVYRISANARYFC